MWEVHHQDDIIVDESEPIDVEEEDDDEEEEEEEDLPKKTASTSKLRKQANHFRTLISGGTIGCDVGSLSSGEGLIGRLPDDLLLESFLGDASILDGGVDRTISKRDDGEDEEEMPEDEEYERIVRENENETKGENENAWFSSTKGGRSKKHRRRGAATGSAASSAAVIRHFNDEASISDTEIYLRILHQVMYPVVQSILKENRESMNDFNSKMRSIRLDAIVDEIVSSVLDE